MKNYFIEIHVSSYNDSPVLDHTSEGKVFFFFCGVSSIDNVRFEHF
jgi:hypothetical protein